MKEAGLTTHVKLGENEGLVGLLSKRKSNRTEYNKGAIMMAMMQIENPEYY